MNKKLKIWIGIIWILILIAASIIYLLIVSSINSHMARKPAIYLYPQTDGIVNVSVIANGRLINTIPDYGNGWSVFTTTNSLIENKYDYLYYDAKLKKVELPNEGWVVEYSDLENWFNEYLPLLGLNEKEIYDFKEYWLEELSYKKYYLIKVLSDEYLEENLRLVISPKPDTVIRRNFYFRGLNEKIEIENPKIEKPIREGFTVAEWGGILE